jgi:hypothetical protein
LVLVAASAFACGPAIIESAPLMPAGAASASESPKVRAPQVDPRAGFSAFVLDAAHAAMAAADGSPHDARWDCESAANDIRATSKDEGQKLRAKGNPEFLIAVLGDTALHAKLDPNADSTPAPPPDPDRDDAESDTNEDDRETRAGDRWLSVSASAAVFADGKLRWLAVRGSPESKDGRASDASKRVRLKALPTPLRGALGEVITSLSSPACSLPFLSAADLASLPLSDTLRREATESLPREAGRLKKVCALAARTTGAWDVTLSRLQVAFSVKDEVLQLRADLRIEKGHVCLGPVHAIVKD